MADHELCTWEEQWVVNKYNIQDRVYQPELKILRLGTFQPDQHREVIESLIDDLCWGILEEFTKRNLPYSCLGCVSTFVKQLSRSNRTNQCLIELGIQLVRDIAYGDFDVERFDQNYVRSVVFDKGNFFLLSRRYWLRKVPSSYFPSVDDGSSWDNNYIHSPVMDTVHLVLCLYCLQRKGLQYIF